MWMRQKNNIFFFFLFLHHSLIFYAFSSYDNYSKEKKKVKFSKFLSSAIVINPFVSIISDILTIKINQNYY